MGRSGRKCIQGGHRRFRDHRGWYRYRSYRPTFGADDYRVGRENGIPPLTVIDREGNVSPLVDKKGRFIPIDDMDKKFVRENG